MLTKIKAQRATVSNASSNLPSMPLDSHDLDEDGLHWEDECELCIERIDSVQCECRCGLCCQHLIIEATLRDAEREPRIGECRPLVDDNLGMGPVEVIGYTLNDRENGIACRFYDRHANACTIYETRPLVCRLFNCDEEYPQRFGNRHDSSGFPV